MLQISAYLFLKVARDTQFSHIFSINVSNGKENVCLCIKGTLAGYRDLSR